MKQLTFSVLLFQTFISLGQMMSSGVYSTKKASVFKGETNHFSSVEITTHLIGTSGFVIMPMDKEEVVFVLEGQATVALQNSTTILSASSVFVVMPGDSAIVAGDAKLLCMTYQARNPKDSAQQSFIIDYNAIEFKPHDRGGVRNYFRRSTMMCPYYEMHMTTLNSGLKSHDPHTHGAAEIILVIEGDTQMLIGDSYFKGSTGDFFFIESGLLHGIETIGDTQARYFAFQWD